MTTQEQPRSAPFLPRNVLTAREKDVLELLAQGWTAREAAGHVKLKARTVERHVENLRLKLHARNTPHLVARAFATGALKVSKGVVKVAN